MPDTLVPVTVTDVRRSGERHVVLLEETGGERRLPIWIGLPEAYAIAGLLERVELPRPGSYDFAAALLNASRTQVREVRISRLAESVFYADVVLAGGETVDARPSDAIALALTTGAPITASAEVLEQAADDGVEATGDDRRVLATETRERLARQAAELSRKP